MIPSHQNERSCTTLPLRTHVSRHPITVLYEDDQYIVFDKPTGLLVIPTPRNERKTLTSIVNQQYVQQKDLWKLHPCHRIDKETSGAIIFAKGKRAQQLMMELFKKRAITKKYVAFIHGRLPAQSGEFRKPIERAFQKELRKSAKKIDAITRYKVLNCKKRYSIVEVQPITGRTNQIRIHFSQAGNPLVGDRKYAFARDYALKFRRTALHAASLEWTHPITHKTVKVQSHLPKDMTEFMAKY